MSTDSSPTTTKHALTRRSNSPSTDTVNHKICTSYFVTFQPSLLQLKRTWFSVSPTLGSRRRRIVMSLHFQPATGRAGQFFLKIAPSHGASGPSSIVHGSLCPPESTSQTASQSISRFLQDSRLWQTDRPTDHTTPSVTIGCIYMVVRCSLIIVQ